MKADNLDSRIIYSTGLGSICPDCNKPKNSCVCRQMKREALPMVAGAVRIRFETTGRKGKAVTLITGLPLSKNGLLELAKELKQQFGTGGAVKNHIIELQGDHRERVRDVLRGLGYSV